jgi:hypothetical protein
MEPSSSPPHIVIVTRHDDFHAHVVRHVLRDDPVRCSIILADRMACVGGLSWETAAGSTRGSLHDADDREVDVGDIDVIWWRRLTGEPRIPVRLSDDAARALIINDCRSALLGVFLTGFTGTWISNPEATQTAHNKLVQLRSAQHCGLRIPRTLVSQEPGTVRRFCDSITSRVIVKPVAGSPDTPVMTGFVTPDVLVDEDIRVCPAIYQEFVPGSHHLRVCCFGADVHCALLQTDALDWRFPLEAAVEPHRLDRANVDKVVAVVEKLGLRMGIIDMKLDSDGTPVWLEINPQGQFLFLEGMCSEMPLTRLFADFLMREAGRAATRRTRA